MTAANVSPGDWATVKVRRFPQNPIITPALFPNRQDGDNINGPTLIRAPAWVKNPLGKYYLYFAHHAGKHLRLAIADDLAGPWRLHADGVLPLDQLPVKMSHIASPEVLVDAQAKRLILYYHGPARDPVPPPNPGQWRGQLTFAATSEDGITFAPRPEVIASFYLRVFPHDGKLYGICRGDKAGGTLCRSADPLAGFEQGPAILPNSRHYALLPRGDALWIFFSRPGDCPEHILMTRFNLKSDWKKWGEEAPPPVSVIKPEEAWEGTQFELEPSNWGSATQVQELRDLNSSPPSALGR